MAKLATLVDILKAAGEVTRLRLLALLAQGELSVKDLTDILGQSQPRVSRHLKLLADAGLIARQAEGSWAYYRLAEESGTNDVIRRLVAQIDSADTQHHADLIALKQVRKTHRAQADAYFAQIAESWDKVRSLHVPDSGVEAAIVRAAGNRDIEHMIDLGTGTGRMLELLAKQYQQGTGIDSSREMVAVARAKLAEASIAHSHVQLGDIAQLSANLGRGDLILLHQVLHYFDDPGKILTEAARVLAPGGRVIVVDFGPHKLEFLRDDHAHRRLGLSNLQMNDWARTCGLNVVEHREFPNEDAVENLTVCLWVLSKNIE